MKYLKSILLDTSGTYVEVVYLGEDGTTDYIAKEGRWAAVNLLPAINELLSRNGVCPSELQAVGAVCGPGSFTGLRIAVCTANAYSNSLNIPCFTINSLEAVAVAEQGEVTVVKDASNGLSYIAVYNCGEEVVSPMVVKNEELLAYTSGRVIQPVTNEQGLKQAIKLLVGERRFEKGEIAPLYIRPSQVGI